MLHKSLTSHGLGILECIQVPINQNTYDGLTSWTYNVGVAAACKSTAIRKLNAGDHDGACKELLRWNLVNGREVRGLTNRRKVEYAMCMKPEGSK